MGKAAALPIPRRQETTNLRGVTIQFGTDGCTINGPNLGAINAQLRELNGGETGTIPTQTVNGPTPTPTVRRRAPMSAEHRAKIAASAKKRAAAAKKAKTMTAAAGV